MQPSRRLSITRLTRETASPSERIVAEEVPIAISVCGIGYAVMMATPADLEDFAIGFASSERFIESADQIVDIEHVEAEGGILLSIELVPDRRSLIFDRVRHRVGDSSCGLCGIENLQQALRPLPALARPARALKSDRLFTSLETIRDRQTLNGRTGAVHAAAFFDGLGEFVALREDVGRHNAFDKLIGHAMRSGVSLTDGFALLSSRCSYELVEKAALSGIGLLVTMSAPTSLAVSRAEEVGLTLIALARADAMLVMTDPYGLYSAGI